MGIFGGLGKRLKDGRIMSGFQAAQATLNGDYAGAASIYANQAERQRKGKEAEAEAEQMRQLHATIDADPALSTPEAKAYAKTNPKAYAEAYLSRFQARQFGAAGGSVGTPGANGQMQFQMAPSRHEFQGSVFDVSGGTPGEKSAVTPQHEGTQWITPQPGTQAFPVNSFTGADRTGGSGTARPTPPVLTDDDILKLDAQQGQGGAGFTAPRTFPY